MRYLLAILVCALGAWSIVNYMNDSAPERPEKPPVVSEGVQDQPAAGDAEAQKALESLSVPAMSDPLAETIYDVLRGLIEADFGEADRLSLEKKMAKAMSDEKLGDEASIANAAKTAVDRMLREAKSARDAGAPTGPMSSFQSKATIALSGRFSGSLRRAMRNSREGKVHEGELLSLGLDFDVPEGYKKATWEIIGGFHYVENMELPASVLALHKKKVGLAGYMMALGEFEDIHIFAVVESQWSCCFGTPPDIHQIVEVTLEDKAPGVELTQYPVLVLGTLEVGEYVEDGWVVSIHRMQAESVDVLE